MGPFNQRIATDLSWLLELAPGTDTGAIYLYRLCPSFTLFFDRLPPSPGQAHPVLIMRRGRGLGVERDDCIPAAHGAAVAAGRSTSSTVRCTASPAAATFE
jgi:hypothetical protein